MYSQEKLDLIGKMIEDFKDENVSYGHDPDTLIDCIKTVIDFGSESKFLRGKEESAT